MNRRPSVALSLAVTLVLGGGSVGCHSAAPAQSPKPIAASAPTFSVLDSIPADTPYLLAVLESPPEAVRRLWTDSFSTSWRKALSDAGLDPDQVAAGIAHLEDAPPWVRAIGVLVRELSAKPASQWWESLGFAHSGRFAVFGIGFWPAGRIEVSDPKRLDAILRRAIAPFGAAVQEKRFGDQPYWIYPADKFTGLVALRAHDLTFAVLPADAIDAALPTLLAHQPIANSLRDAATIKQLEERHHLLPVMLGYLDTKQLLEPIVKLAAPRAPQLWAGPDAPCRADLERISETFPRLVFGYRELDARRFSAAFVIDLPRAIAHELVRLRRPMPGAPAGAHPLMSLSTGLDVDGTVAFVHDLAAAIVAKPLRCPLMVEVNATAQKLEGLAQNGLPQMARDIHGLELVLDDYVAQPRTVTGSVLLVGDRVSALASTALAMIPGLASVVLAPGAAPVPLPTAPLAELGVTSSHVGVRADRLAWAVGGDSERRARERLAAASSALAPLLVWVIDVPRLRQLLAELGEPQKDDDGTLAKMGAMTVTLDASDAGLELGIGADWAAGVR